MHVLLCFLSWEGKICACGFGADCAVGVGEDGVDDDDVATLLADMGTDGNFAIGGEHWMLVSCLHLGSDSACLEFTCHYPSAELVK